MNTAISFTKDFFKLIINSVYGKAMGNVRKRINVRLVNNEKDFLKYTSRPTHITHKVFAKNYVAIHEIIPVITLNKPIYFRFTFFESSKWLMYDFHCSFIKKCFDAELLTADTDSFKYKHLFDFSNYTKNSNFFDEANKKVIDKMKDESERKVIGKFVRVKSKMYSKVLRHKMRRIQNKKHKLGTCEINKISLWCFDDKRFVLDDGIHTIAYFHKDIDSHK